MPRLFPSQSRDTERESEPWLVGLDDAGDEVFDALTAETAREILAELYEEPRAASELADSVDTSLQNARYHLDNLQSAGLVTVAETCYSSKGTEMDIYAPAGDPLMVVVGDGEGGPVREALGSLVDAER